MRRTAASPPFPPQVRARPQAATLSKTLRLFEAEGTSVTKLVKLPPNDGNMPWVYCTDQKVHVRRADQDTDTVRQRETPYRGADVILFRTSLISLLIRTPTPDNAARGSKKTGECGKP